MHTQDRMVNPDSDHADTEGSCDPCFNLYANELRLWAQRSRTRDTGHSSPPSAAVLYKTTGLPGEAQRLVN